jgi:hypothetical protein
MDKYYYRELSFIHIRDDDVQNKSQPKDHRFGSDK